jgi:hypothetical protein
MAKLYENLSREEMLERAWHHIFSMGLHDSANMLCDQNMKFGLAKLHYLQYSMGFEPNATFIGSPDATVTRNLHRWENGFGYGGKLSWGEGQHEMVVLDAMPNACGMLAGGLEELPRMSDVLEVVKEYMAKGDHIDGIDLKWDFAVGNHFIDLYKLKPMVDDDDDISHPFAFIIHGSVPELRGDNNSKYGFGLYYYKSKELQNMAETIETPFGDAHVVTGADAQKYLELNNYASSLAMKKRLRAAKNMFGQFNIISNPTHQELVNMNEIILGSQDTLDKSTMGVFPLALRADLPAYLIRGKENLSDAIIETLGFNKRAEEWGVKHRLLNANIIPHGGGYMFPSILSVKRVIETPEGKRFFVTDLATGHDSEKIFANPRDIEFSYRGRRILTRCLDLQLGEVVASLMPRVVFKI